MTYSGTRVMSHSIQQQSLDAKNDLEKIIVTKTTRELVPTDGIDVRRGVYRSSEYQFC